MKEKNRTNLEKQNKERKSTIHTQSIINKNYPFILLYVILQVSKFRDSILSECLSMAESENARCCKDSSGVV